MNGNMYGGTTMAIDMRSPNDNNQLKTNQLASYNGDDVDYPTNNRARVMSEIIV